MDSKIMTLKECMPSLVGTRWENKEALEKWFKHYYQISNKLGDIDESGLVGDYAFLLGVYEDFGYIDIYYLKIPFGEKTIYITEVSVSEE